MIQVLVDGLVAASFIALGVIGLSLIYNILNFPSFAHGDHLTIGAYFGLVVVLVIGTAGSIGVLTFGWPLIVATFFAAILTGLLAQILDRAIYGQLRRKGSSRITLIIASFGVALMLRHIVVMFFGPDPVYYSFAIQPAIRFWGIRITPNELVVLGVTAVMVVGLHLFLSRTRLGKAMRAVAENPSLARVNGIDVDGVIRWTWLIGAGLAAIGGVLFGMAIGMQPFFGFELLLPMFAALIVGGMTNIYGAILGAILIGVAESITVKYFAAEYRQAVSFLAVIVVLMFRPQGLFGEKE
ncbi:branched-chain amino acid ABC transporter permease [Ferrovibrio sp.]|uniref:branched-chain amino acid ABC transporter permease n=1 Tax=Ferrovibrio sp. TaxID=1917215 RepID=UPI0025B9498A|nr:branched-chain amino acid ABC transporter permease [Ferrovibrio sp.]MBX3454654.1 branched-chain amino acid ABC transporter permease [Ferrovibrio sp.]